MNELIHYLTPDLNQPLKFPPHISDPAIADIIAPSHALTGIDNISGLHVYGCRLPARQQKHRPARLELVTMMNSHDGVQP